MTCSNRCESSEKQTGRLLRVINIRISPFVFRHRPCRSPGRAPKRRCKRKTVFFKFPYFKRFPGEKFKKNLTPAPSWGRVVCPDVPLSCASSWRGRPSDRSPPVAVRAFSCVCFFTLTRGVVFRSDSHNAVRVRARYNVHERQHNRDSHDRRGRESDLFIILSCLDKNLRLGNRSFSAAAAAARDASPHEISNARSSSYCCCPYYYYYYEFIVRPRQRTMGPGDGVSRKRIIIYRCIYANERTAGRTDGTQSLSGKSQDRKVSF